MAVNYSTPSYPYNINPQFRDTNPTTPTPCLTCPPDNSLEAIVFNCNKLSVIKGWQTKSDTSLEEFFVPCENYLEYELNIKPHISDQFITLNYGNVADENGNVPFLMILPLYYLNSFQPSECHLNYRQAGYIVPFTCTDDSGYSEPPIENEWSELGRILMIGATATKPIKPIQIQNTSDEVITCRILIAS